MGRVPKWFAQAAADQRASIRDGDATKRTAADALVTLILDEHPDFARRIIADFARPALTEPPKRHRWRSAVMKTSDMKAAARMRERGMSLRAIAEALDVSEVTVRRDLAEWEADHGNVAALHSEDAPLPGVWSAREGGRRLDVPARHSGASIQPEMTQQIDADPRVVPFRRSS